MVFTPTLWSSRWKIDCIIDIVYAGGTLQRGELVLGAWTPHKDLQGKVPLLWGTRTSKEKDNSPLQPRCWDGPSSLAAWVVASQHQNHYQWKTSYNTVEVAAVRPTGLCWQDIGGRTFGRLMQVEAGESDDGGSSYRHSKTGRRKSGSQVTGRFARKLVPSDLQSRVDYEGGNYAQ